MVADRALRDFGGHQAIFEGVGDGVITISGSGVYHGVGGLSLGGSFRLGGANFNFLICGRGFL